ncbi:M48 family metallopeptidase [Flavobacterium terrigena]|uniref:Peptidase family M48 n=1 Tax=Flavobacterium terrigena TaxID=402734 RepID=A0A1H6Q2Z7_9FLAO|nr:M48 family metallopeptidase [Flavobacterium terrigena]SEI38211.1 Peptidase family M48 [Flavobacterium terrigena]
MENYQAILIHPDVKGGRISGNLSIKNNCIYFENEELTHQINFINLTINTGGASNRFIFFADKTNTEISIYTSDKKVLKNNLLASNKNFKSEISKSKSDLRKTLKGVLIAIALVGIFITGLYLAKDKMVEKIADQVPASWEKEAGDKLFSTLSLQYKFIKNDSLEKEFLKVAQPLLKQIEKDGFKVDLYFVKDPTINAFALPGGKVIIQTGLIENAKSWEEVMGVVSHELSHVTRRHHIRGIINNLGIFTILSAAFGDVSALAGTFLNVGGELASLSNSRDFEHEADETGWKYLVQAKINPKGLITFFETLSKEEKANEIKSKVDETIDLSFLSTHPNTKDRISALKEKLKGDKSAYIKLPDNFEKFKIELLKQKIN